MESPVPRPDTINKLRFAADAAFAMLAGMQLDVFTPLQEGPKTAEGIAHAFGVGPARLRLLLYGSVVAGLLTEQDGRFSNTSEASQCGLFVSIDQAPRSSKTASLKSVS